ncbi:hypothetical protein VIGAN_11167900 [Vigna angularis var. angularis]|uniref:Uncharacterized protein n=1 Tax=Vigna angularis var. angularis TaxID=157739 RepID=A0A0S3TAG0_PHAAN|nr:hypothetical protein VIGAN_11167900 [Vigna angularis var. angularis]
MSEKDLGWDFHLRKLSVSGRDSNTANDPASDPSLLPSVKKLHALCKTENSEDLVAMVYTSAALQIPSLNLEPPMAFFCL